MLKLDFFNAWNLFLTVLFDVIGVLRCAVDDLREPNDVANMSEVVWQGFDSLTPRLVGSSVEEQATYVFLSVVVD